jgi:diacylglycerol O-acyltransferase / wax synthase
MIVVTTSIDRLTPLDRLMLWASRQWPQDIGALAVLDGGPLLDDAGRFRIDLVRDAIASRLHQVPRFRQFIHQPRWGLGGPLWVDAPTFDLTRHVRELPLEPPAGESEMLAAVEQLLRQRLDPSRPLWEMWFLTGLPERRVGLFVKIHHTIADGMAAMATRGHVPRSCPRQAAGSSAPVESGAVAIGARAPRGQRGAPRSRTGRRRVSACPTAGHAAPAACRLARDS